MSVVEQFFDKLPILNGWEKTAADFGKAIEIAHEQYRDVLITAANIANENESIKKQLDEANKRIAEAEEVIKHYAGEGDRRTYLDVFDCISRESESVTDFDSDRFAKAARAYLNKYSDKKGE